MTGRPSSRRLLVVSYHFPPDGSIGGQRWGGITKYLSHYGWAMHVLTAAGQGDSGERPGVVVESCKRLATLNDLYRRISSVRRRRGASPHPGPTVDRSREEQGKEKRGSVVRRVRLELGVLLALPDHARGWMWRAAVRIRRILREFRPSIIVSSGPPHTAHLAVLLGTLGSRTPWLIDLRDPWAGPVMDAWRAEPFERSWIGRNTIARLEKLAFRSAAGLLTNTPELAAALSSIYPTLQSTAIFNAVDLERLPPPTRCPFPGLAITYAGTLYGHRDLQPVLEALRLFLDRHPSARASTRLRVAGNVETRHGDSLQESISLLGLAEHVEILGRLSASDALTLVSRSGLSVVLAQDQPLQVPAKLYESIGMRVPTLVVGSRNSAAGREAERVGAAVREPHDTVGIVELFECLLSGGDCRLALRPELRDYRHIAGVVDRVLSGQELKPG